MNQAAVMSNATEIVVDEVFPHTPEKIWKVLTDGNLVTRWLMPLVGWAPKKGTHFSFPTKPEGDWDGVIHCEVLDVMPNERLVYTWKSGVDTPSGYVPRLDTLVTWTLSRHDGGTRLRLVHSGFVMPKNAGVFQNISGGWMRVIGKMIAVVAELKDE